MADSMHSSHSKPPLKPKKKGFMARTKSFYSNSKTFLGLKKKKEDPVQIIPNRVIELWVENRWSELNRFAKLSSTPHLLQGVAEDTSWQSRIATDIIRTRRLEIQGDCEEVFDFPDFETLEDKETLLCTVRNYLSSSIDDIITQTHENLDAVSLQQLTNKVVDQVLVSLCQEFINQPYFMHLKLVTNEYELEPVACDIAPHSDWKVASIIEFRGNRIYTRICRTFKVYRHSGIEMEDTTIGFGFKRTFVIDCLGGPPKIMPPIWLGLQDGHAFEFEAKVKKSAK